MLGVIINPKSGKRAYRMQRMYLWNLLRERHIPYEFRVTKYAAHATELARELVEDFNCDEILVLGGDGTLSEALNGIMRAKISAEQRRNIKLGLMPRGTGNDWGRYWNLTKNYREAIERFLSGEGHPLDVGCVTYWRNHIEHHRYFINSVGFGVDPLCCQKAEKLKYYLGSHHFNYVIGLIGAIAQQKPIPMQLIVDGEVLVDEPLFTMNVGNGPFSGGGIRQNPEADPQDGVFHAMFVCKPTLMQVIKALPNLFNGHLTELPFIHAYKGKDIRMETEEHLMFEADGILHNVMGPTEIHCIHHAIQFKVKM